MYNNYNSKFSKIICLNKIKIYFQISKKIRKEMIKFNK